MLKRVFIIFLLTFNTNAVEVDISSPQKHKIHVAQVKIKKIPPVPSQENSWQARAKVTAKRIALLTTIYGGYFIYCSRSIHFKLSGDAWDQWADLSFKRKINGTWNKMGNAVDINQKDSIIGISNLTNAKFLGSYLILMLASFLIPPTSIEKKCFSA